MLIRTFPNYIGIISSLIRAQQGFREPILVRIIGYIIQLTLQLTWSFLIDLFLAIKRCLLSWECCVRFCMILEYSSKQLFAVSLEYSAAVSHSFLNLHEKCNIPFLKRQHELYITISNLIFIHFISPSLRS